ncbi:MAG TPA: hypothetical protein VFS20_23375 [Longimicrobium sp.]|nr:hypothetical protein [Longimicrobium sp.]
MLKPGRGGAALALCLFAIAAPSRAAAHEGWGVVIDHQGRIYVADIPANVIWRISPDGRAEPVARGIHSHGLAIGPDGAVYGTDVEPAGGSRRVWRLDSGGRMQFIVPPGAVDGMGLQSFLVGPDGALYSASAFQPGSAPGNRTLHLLRRRVDGTIDTLAGGAVGWRDGTGAAAQFRAIDGMAWLPDGSIVVADGARLRRVDLAGNVRTLTRPLSRTRWDEDILGVAVAPDGTLIAADFAGRTIRRWPDGPAPVPSPSGRYWSPAGVAAARGGIYVLEHPRAPFGLLGDLGVGPYLRLRWIGANGQSRVLTRQWGRNTGVAAAGIALIVAIPLAWRRARGRSRRPAAA